MVQYFLVSHRQLVIRVDLTDFVPIHIVFNRQLNEYTKQYGDCIVMLPEMQTEL